MTILRILLISLIVFISISSCSQSQVRQKLPYPIATNPAPNKLVVNKAVIQDVSKPSLNQNSLKLKTKYSISAFNIPINEILFQLCVDAKLNLSLDPMVEGLVSINAVQLPLQQILTSLLISVGAKYVIDGNNLKVIQDLPQWRSYPIDYVNLNRNSVEKIAMNLSLNQVSKTDISSSNLESIAKHDLWGNLVENVKTMLDIKNPRSGVEHSGKNKKATRVSRVFALKEAGLLSVFATDFKHKEVKLYLDKVMQRVKRQVLIEVKVLEVTLLDRYRAGIDWQAIFGNFSAQQSIVGNSFSGAVTPFIFNFSSGGFDNFVISALQEYGDIKVLSTPRIMAVSNQTALLKVVNNEVYFTTSVQRDRGTNGNGDVVTIDTQVHSIPVGFVMSVTPFISDDNKVSLSIRPTISRVVRFVKDPNPELENAGVESFIPVIQEREMATVLNLNNRNTAIIGGLIQDSIDKQRRGIPGLQDIPYLGKLFSFQDDKLEKNELVIFIRPIVLDGN